MATVWTIFGWLLLVVSLTLMVLAYVCMWPINTHAKAHQQTLVSLALALDHTS